MKSPESGYDETQDRDPDEQITTIELLNRVYSELGIKAHVDQHGQYIEVDVTDNSTMSNENVAEPQTDQELS